MNSFKDVRRISVIRKWLEQYLVDHNMLPSCISDPDDTLDSGETLVRYSFDSGFIRFIVIYTSAMKSACPFVRYHEYGMIYLKTDEARFFETPFRTESELRSVLRLYGTRFVAGESRRSSLRPR